MEDTTTRNGAALDGSTLERFRRALVRRRRGVREHFAGDPAERAEHRGILAEIDRALDRIDRGTFGHCDRCEGGVEVERLERDFTTRVCLAHYGEDEIRELERDLGLAAEVQRDQHPEPPALTGWRLATWARPAGIVAGDYHGFFPMANGRQGLAIADVMGKGLAAGLLVSSLAASLRILGPQHDEPADLVRRINELFRYDLDVISFITLLVAELDPEEGRLRYCSAGHEPVLWRRTAAREVARLAATGPAIGLVADAAYGTDEVLLARGDVALFYTDGLVETHDGAGRAFGEERLAERMSDLDAGAPALLERLVAEVSGSPAQPLADDLTMIAIERS